jgi:transposase
MSPHAPLSRSERERVYQDKLDGETLVEIAAKMNCSLACVRKWWRTGRDTGLESLRAVRRGRGKTGRLSRFARLVAELALQYKHQHRHWGAKRVQVELRQEPRLAGISLPQRSSLAAFFKERCPELLASYKKRAPEPPPLPSAQAVHEVWQLDSQEKIALANGEIATVCNIRDPLGAAMIASRAFSVKTEKHYRKLDWRENQRVLRAGFTEWHTLPDAVLTDNELGLAGGPNDPFPGLLTFWLVGLGVQHRFIHPGRPTEQPQIERNHRTLDDFALDEGALTDLDHLQQALDRERRLHNQDFPSQASDCAGRPPLVAHPELLTPRRYYQPDHELLLFDLPRVYRYLASFHFERKVNASGQVSLGRHLYSMGRQWVAQLPDKQVVVRLDAEPQEWVFGVPEKTDSEESLKEIARRKVKGLDATTLTGLDPLQAGPTQPVQLRLPLDFV